MSNICKNCQFYQKETLEVSTAHTTLNQDTWISKADPNIPQASPIEFARCSNGATTNQMINRDANGQWFFDTDFLKIVTPIVVTCENSTCENFTAI